MYLIQTRASSKIKKFKGSYEMIKIINLLNGMLTNFRHWLYSIHLNIQSNVSGTLKTK